jgi:hypothetical protein
VGVEIGVGVAVGGRVGVGGSDVGVAVGSGVAVGGSDVGVLVGEDWKDGEVSKNRVGKTLGNKLGNNRSVTRNNRKPPITTITMSLINLPKLFASKK